MKKITGFIVSLLALSVVFAGCSKEEMKDAVEDTMPNTTTTQTQTNQTNQPNQSQGIVKKQIATELKTAATLDEAIDKKGSLSIDNKRFEFRPEGADVITINISDIKEIIIDFEDDNDVDMDDNDEVKIMTDSRIYDFEVPVGFGKQIADHFNVKIDK